MFKQVIATQGTTLDQKLAITDNYPDADMDASLKESSVTDFSLHGCDAIVNASNMEVRFGGGGRISTFWIDDLMSSITVVFG